MPNDDELHIVNFRATTETLDMLRAVARDEDRSVTSWLRHVIRQRYEARFGETKPRKKSA